MFRRRMREVEIRGRETRFAVRGGVEVRGIRHAAVVALDKRRRLLLQSIIALRCVEPFIRRLPIIQAQRRKRIEIIALQRVVDCSFEMCHVRGGDGVGFRDQGYDRGFALERTQHVQVEKLFQRAAVWRRVLAIGRVSVRCVDLEPRCDVRVQARGVQEEKDAVYVRVTHTWGADDLVLFGQSILEFALKKVGHVA